MTNITPNEAAEIMKTSENALILDVRTPGEYISYHVPNAINIPVQELFHRLDELDTEKEIIVLCEHGFRSVNASYILEHAGFECIYNMVGGMSRWPNEIVTTA